MINNLRHATKTSEPLSIDRQWGTADLGALSKSKEKSFLPGIEALRGLAAFAVVVEHGFPNTIYPTAGLFEGELDSLSIFQWFLHILFNGRAAVMLFFVLSGFVLARQWEGIAGNFPTKLISYIIRRIFRIVPVMWVSVFFAYWMAIELRPGFGVNRQLLLNTLFFQDFSLNGPLWSAIVEIWCSLLFPFLYSLNSRLSRNFQFLLLLPLALIVYLPFLENANFLRYLVFFQIGILVGKYGESNIDRIEESRLIFLFFTALFVYGVTPQLWAFHTDLFNYPDGKNYLIFEMPACYFLLSYVVSGKNALLSRLLALSAVRYIGKISFSLYVLHYVVMSNSWPAYALSPELIFLWPYPILFQTIFFLLLTIVSVPLAMFTFRYIELPFNSLGRKIGRQVSDWLNPLAPEMVASSKHYGGVRAKAAVIPG